MGPPSDGHNGLRTNPQNKEFIGIVFAVLLAVVMSVLLLMVALHPAFACCRRRSVKDKKKHLERRRRTVKQWTINKPAIDHEQCQSLQKQHGLSPGYPSDECGGFHEDSDGTESTISSDDSSKEVQTCWICFEPFRIGERVAWSSTNHCRHSFHYFCIEEWLIHHEHCPTCRRVYMLCDSHKKASKTDMKAVRRDYEKRRQTTYFCIRDGLVSTESFIQNECEQNDKIEADARHSHSCGHKLVGSSAESDQDAVIYAEEGCSEALTGVGR